MQELSQLNYSTDQVKKALQSNRTIKWEYLLLDKNNRKIDTLRDITSSYGMNAEAEIKGTARFEINEADIKEINFFSERIKPLFCLKIDQNWLKWEQGIYLPNSPNRTEQKGSIYRNIEAYDQGVILNEDRVDNRFLIAKGTPYTSIIRSLILSSGLIDVSIQESELELSIDKEYEIGTSKLEIINDLLLSINYNSVWFNHRGTCMITKFIPGKERNYDYVYATDSESIMPYGATEILDYFNVPNKFVRYVENPETDYLISTFINEQASNKLSTVSRGRTITDIQSVTDIADQETLDSYVRKVAEEKSLIYGGFNYTSLVMPHHSFMDCLLFRNNNLGVSQKVIETAWSIDTTGAGTMSHTCKKVIELW